MSLEGSSVAEIEPTLRTRILIREVMNSPVISTGPNATLKTVAGLMARFDVGSIIILDGDDKPLGMVTDGDIVLKAVSKGLNPSRVHAKDIMSQPLQTIDSSKDITDAARLMRKLKVKRLGVTYKDKLVGAVSVSDLTAVTPELFELVSEKTRIMTGESRQQKGYLAGYCDICTQWSDFLTESDGQFVCDECSGEHAKP